MTDVNQLITEHLDIWTSATEKKSSAGRGNGGAVSLRGIMKLRELILELAIRGKLVSQDEQDEPADVLLQRIENSNREKLKQRKKRGQTTNDEAKPLFSAPVGWSWTPLSGVASVIRGVTYKKSDAISSEKTGYVPLLRGNNIGRTLNYDELVFVPNNLVKEDQLVRQGDIVIAMSSGSANLVGKASQSNDNIEKTFGAFCGVVRPQSSELKEFFRFFFQTPLYRNATQAAGKGIGINNLNKSVLERVWVPLPPLEEQHRIVTKVDELMALCDALERQTEDSFKAHQTLVETCLATLTNSQSPEDLTQNWTRIEAHFDTLFTTEESIQALEAAIVELGVTGLLVPQIEADEPATQLLQRVAKDIAAYSKLNKVRPVKPTEITAQESQAGRLPSGWVETRLSSLFRVVTDGDHQAPPRASDGVAFLTIGNISSGQLNFEGCRTVPDDYYNGLPAYRTPGLGDILYTVVGATYGRPVLVETEEQFCVQRHIAILKPSVELDVDYLVWMLKSAWVYNQARDGITGSAQPTLALKPLRNFLILLPPRAQQERISSKIKQLHQLTAKLRESISVSTETEVSLADTLTSKIH